MIEENATQPDAHSPVRARLVAELSGHTMTPWRVRFSPDGRLLLSGAEDDASQAFEIGLWDVERHTLIRLLDTAGYMPVFFPDGASVVFGSLARRRVVRCALDGRVIAEYADDLSRVVGVVVSPDGRWLAIGDGQSRVELWDAQAQTRVQAFATHTTSAGRFPYCEPRGFSPDGRWLLMDAPDQRGASQLFELVERIDGGVQPIWRAALGGAPGRQGGVRGSAFSPDGRWLALATDGADGLLLVELPSLEQTRLPALADALQDVTAALTFSPDGRWLAEVTTAQGRAALWQIPSGALEATWEAHTDYYRMLGGDQLSAVYDVDWSPAGRYLATAGHGVQPGAPSGHDAQGAARAWARRRVARRPADRRSNVIRLWEIERDEPQGALRAAL